jgi:DNA polymerase elongation subunit (family B)
VQLPIQNIYGGNDRKIWLFLRDENGNQIIKSDNTYTPYYFEPSNEPNPKFRGYDGTPLKIIPVSRPYEVRKFKTSTSWGNDIPYTTSYKIDKIDSYLKSPIKWLMIDTEQCVGNNDIKDYANNPFTAIASYCNFTNKYDAWAACDFSGSIKARETKILSFFIDYVKKERPDIIFAYNSSHDYNYFHHRIQMRWNKVFAELISPIGQTRWAKDDVFLPAGISIVDYMGLYRKVEQKKGSYALNDVMEDELGVGKAHADIDFNDWTNPELKQRNIEDVVALVEIEEKKKLIPYYDIVRRETTVDWEELPMQVTYNEGKEQKISNNSKMIDMLVLREAKRRNIVLPNKNYKQDQEHIKGASRELDCPNRFMGVYQVDVSGCYPGGIIDFCLDTQNIIDNPEDYKGKYPVCKVGDYYFKQNPDALLPTVTRHWLALKDEFKQKKESMDKSDPDYVTIKTKYDALKGICNSLFGVIALKTFRLYDLRVAGAITWIGRSILDYADKRLRENGYKVLEKDTDGIKIHSSDPTLTDKCNSYVQEWSMSNYNRNSSLRFDKEGIYKTIFLKAMCHYFGYIDSGDGKLEEKMKGMEAKRGNSSKFVKTFQKKLIEKILELNEKEDNWLHSEQTIVNWIKSEIIRFKTLPLFEVAFPTTLKRPLENYTKKQEIFVRAVKNTKLIMPDFMPPLGSRFWWIHVKPNAPKVATLVYVNNVLTKTINENVDKKVLLSDPKKYELIINETDKIKIIHEKTITDDVIAFDKKNYNHVKNIDYDVLIEKQIVAKVEPIFEPLGWNIKKIRLLDTTPNNVV